MKRLKLLFLIGTVGSLLLAGCGSNAGESSGNETVSEETAVESAAEAGAMQEKSGETGTEGTEPTEAEKEETASENTEEQKVEETITEPVIIEDTNVYGNTVSNILNGGLFLTDDSCFYLYHGYDNCVYQADMETGISRKIEDGYLVYLNKLDGKLYGYRAETGEIVETDIESGDKRVLCQGNVGYLTAVDEELYYLELSDGSVRKFDLEKEEETVLVEEQASTLAIYKDNVYFSQESDKGSLYSVPRAGGEETKLNDILTYMPCMYRDRIYYLGMEGGAYSIRSMALDGSDEKILVRADAFSMNLYEDKLYYIDNSDKSKLYFVDLTAEEATPVEVDLSERIKEAVNTYGMEPVSEYQIDAYQTFCFQQDYMLFMCEETMDGEMYMDEYLYDFIKDEIIPVAYFFVDEAEWQKAVQEKEEAEKNAAKEAEAQASARSYPAGNYSPGSVYGPKLSQAELNQVADVVQAYMNSYDFSSMSDYDKVATAHDYLSSVCEYAPDWRLNQANTAWGALVYHEAQCSGYARAMKALCDAMGVGCHYVHADAGASNPSHQWNEVCINGNWYIIDVQANDKSGFKWIYLVSDDTYASSTGMSWDRSAVPACPADYGN